MRSPPQKYLNLGDFSSEFGELDVKPDVVHQALFSYSIILWIWDVFDMRGKKESVEPAGSFNFCFYFLFLVIVDASPI